MRKMGVLVVCMGICFGQAVAQKGVTKAVTTAAKPKIAVVRPPLIEAARVPTLSKKLQQNLLQNWDTALQAQLERTALQEVSKQKALSLQMNIQQRRQYVAERLQPLKDYLATHQNNWPQYNANALANRYLRYIANFMEAQNPSLEVLDLQREIISLRATSNSRTPTEIIKMVRMLMEYGIVPTRATLSNRKANNNVEQIALGEDFAFAVAAAQVPMQDNPWNKLEGLDYIADVINTYNAMRRADPLLESIPESYVGEGGIHYSNIPLLTRLEYVQEQRKFAYTHPFEYALAPFWERVFGRSLYRMFNNLSEVEKKAILFTASQLPQMVDVNSPAFSSSYNNAVNQWEELNHREVNSYAGIGREEALKAFLRDEKMPMQDFFFRFENQNIPFADLRYPQQLEVLMWVWKNLHMLPTRALQRFSIDRRNYF